MIDPKEWEPSQGVMLEPNANTAVRETRRCVALTAGPGAGKTELLAQRADFLLRTGTCRYPKRILAIAFKVDASNNLRERVRRRCSPSQASRFDSFTFHGFAKRIIERFRVVLQGDDALNAGFTVASKGRAHPAQTEFSCLIPLAIKILDTYPIAVNAIRKTYSDVFLDEFQDCTEDQYQLISRLFIGASCRVTAVGDVKQKIMGWAGALDGVFGRFEIDFAAIHLNIYRNFRSQPRLLRLQNEIIKTLDPGSEMPSNLIGGVGGEVMLQAFDSCDQEADYLAERISDWVKSEGVRPSEIAVLVRSTPEAYTIKLVNALNKKNIAHRQESHVQDIMAEPMAVVIIDFLLSIYGKREPKAWARLMRRILPLNEDDIAQGERTNWNRFIKESRKAAAEDLMHGCYDQRWTLLKDFLAKAGVGLFTGLSHDYEARSRLKEVIGEIKRHIDSALAHEPDLIKALSELSSDQSVRILTIHKSKGLEFDSVIMLGVEEQSYWGDINEARCAFFVGVSRAKRRLLVTTVDRRENAGNLSSWRVNRARHPEFAGYIENCPL